MKVTFAVKVILAGKVYQKGEGILPDRFMTSSSFKSLVKKGLIVVAPKSAAEQKAQASKDDLERRKADKAARAAKKKAAEQSDSAHLQAKADFKIAQAIKASKANKG
jgi:hypothetical protein